MYIILKLEKNMVHVLLMENQQDGMKYLENIIDFVTIQNVRKHIKKSFEKE
jgi:hypothetical protein